VSVLKHIRRRHADRPLRLIRRHLSDKPSVGKSTVASVVAENSSLGAPEVKGQVKLRGPRCKREEKFADAADTVWQCPFCSRRSLFLGFMKIHIQLAHPEVDICVSPQRWTVGRGSTDELKPEVKVGFVPVVRVEDVERFTELNKITECNGEDLIRELDVDDELQEVGSPASENDDLLEFRCLHCHFRGANPAVVKCHILVSHPDDDVTILDMRTTRRMNHEHLFMCRSVECQFMSSVQSEFDFHMQQKPSHMPRTI
jgi:hypothetical protein